MLSKDPTPVEVYNDIDGDLVGLFRVLSRGGDDFARFYRMVCLTLYSREVFYESMEELKTETDPVVRAFHYYVVARMSFSGQFGSSWSHAIAHSRRGMAGPCSKWLSMIDMLPEIHNRLSRVQIENREWETVLRGYDTPGTLFYLDPPYIHGTRKSKKLYRHEMSTDDHERLVGVLLGIKGKAFLSGYHHPVYSPLEDAGWNRKDFAVNCNAVGRTRATGVLGDGSASKHGRTESVWYNYEIG